MAVSNVYSNNNVEANTYRLLLKSSYKQYKLNYTNISLSSISQSGNYNCCLTAEPAAIATADVDNSAIIVPSVVLPLFIVSALVILLTIAGCYRQLKRFVNIILSTLTTVGYVITKFKTCT